MARVVVYLLEPEMGALHQLAQQEFRPVKAQAALLIRNELKRLGMVGEADGAAGDLKISQEPFQPAESEA